MSDRSHRTRPGVPSGDDPSRDAHAAVRDALPALLHGRVTAAERDALQAHLEACAPCAGEYRLLALLQEAHAGAPPSVSVDRIAAAVRARTVRAAAPAPRPLTQPPTGRRGPAWASRRTLRAFAATALVALGSGVLVLHGSRPTQPTVASTRTRSPLAAATPRAAAVVDADPNASLLGASFADLSESELAAVVAAVDDPASASPASEPGPVVPDVLTPEGE